MPVNIEAAREKTKTFLNSSLAPIRDAARKLSNSDRPDHTDYSTPEQFTHYEKQRRLHRDEFPYADGTEYLNQKSATMRHYFEYFADVAFNHCVVDENIRAKLTTDKSEARYLKDISAQPNAYYALVDALSAFADSGRAPSPQKITKGIFVLQELLDNAQDDIAAMDSTPPAPEEFDDEIFRARATRILSDYRHAHAKRLPKKLPDYIPANVKKQIDELIELKDTIDDEDYTQKLNEFYEDTFLPLVSARYEITSDDYRALSKSHKGSNIQDDEAKRRLSDNQCKVEILSHMLSNFNDIAQSLGIRTALPRERSID